MVNRSCMFHVKLLLFLFLLPCVVIAQRTTTTVMEVKPLPALPAEDTSIEAYLNTFPSLSVHSMPYQWFYWTNFSRQRPKDFWNLVVAPVLNTYPHLNTRFAASLKADLFALDALPRVKPSSVLFKLSQAHANDLAKNASGKISHNSTNGKSFEKRMSDADVQRCAAENMSLGPGNAVLALIMLYIDEGLPDVGHRKNLLNPYYTEMGIGVAKGKGEMFVVVQDFACDQGK